MGLAALGKKKCTCDATDSRNGNTRKGGTLTSHEAASYEDRGTRPSPHRGAAEIDIRVYTTLPWVVWTFRSEATSRYILRLNRDGQQRGTNGGKRQRVWRDAPGVRGRGSNPQSGPGSVADAHPPEAPDHRVVSGADG